MPTSELLMYVALAVVGAGYWAYNNRSSLLSKVTPGKPQAASQDAVNAFEQEWVATLLRLQAELESDDAPDYGASCVPLTRELVWRFMGGDPNDVPARIPASGKR